jgi:hypothetical protein
VGTDAASGGILLRWGIRENRHTCHHARKRVWFSGGFYFVRIHFDH